MNRRGGIQLPNDVKPVGYKKIRPFQWAQVFTSEKHNFAGTEEEFTQAGFAYRFVQLDEYTVREIE